MRVPFKVGTGTRIECRWPAGYDERWGPEPLAAGQFFTVRVNDEMWRARLDSYQVEDDGATLIVEFEVIGRYGDASLIDPHPYPVYTPTRKGLGSD